MLTILIRKETVRQLAKLTDSDILIRPDLGNFGSTEFENITQTVEPGAAATIAEEHRLAQLSLDVESFAAHKAARARNGGHPERLAFVRVKDDGPLSKEFLESHLAVEPGDTIDPERLADDAKRLYGLGRYEEVGYRLVTEDGEIGVEFDPLPKSWGPNILQFGLSYEDNFEGSTALNVSARLTKTGLNSFGAEWRSDLQIGTDPFLFSEFYQPIGAGARYFIAPRFNMEQRNINAFVAGDAVARYRISEGDIGFDVGRELGGWGELRVGLRRGIGEARVKIGDPSLTNIDFDTGGFLARFRVDTLDDAQIPLYGTRVDLTWNGQRQGLGADEHIDTIETELTSVRTWGRNTLLFGLNYSTTLDSDTSIQEFFPLGGFLRLSGIEKGAISGPHAGVVRLVYYRRWRDSGGPLGVPVYFGGSIEAGNAWQNQSDVSIGSLVYNGSLFAGLDTFVGPLFIGGGISEDGDSSFYLFLGAQPR
jgi:NTE family protein